MADRSRASSPDRTESAPLLATGKSTEQPLNRRFLLLILYSFVFTYNFGAGVAMAPFLQLYENIICRDHYGDVNSPPPTYNDPRCGDDQAVQRELALINGVQDFFLVAPMPYASLADWYGRRMALCLALLSFCLQLTWQLFVCWYSDHISLRWVWLQGLFPLFGGGLAVALSMIYVLVADATELTSRARAFFILDVVRLVATGLGSLASRFLMKFGPWPPLLVAIPLIYVASLLGLLVPNYTLSTDKSSSQAVHWRNGDLWTSIVSLSRRLFSRSRLVSSARSVMSFPKQNITAFVIVTLALFKALGGGSTNVLPQYVHNRFEWEFAQTADLNVLRVAVSLATLLCLLPSVSYLIDTRMNVSASTRDLYLSRFGAIAMLSGCLIIAFASTSALMVLGAAIFMLDAGIVGLLRSMLTATVTSEEIGKYLTLMTLSQYLAESLSGPIYAEIFIVGSHTDWPGIGLVFVIGATFILLVNIGFWFIAIPNEDINGNDSSDARS